MMHQKKSRDIARVVQTAPAAPGFIGEGHTAVQVVNPADFEQNDPFIVLMDDRIALEPGRRAGEAHPHAGFEIATFVVEGELRDRDEGTLRAGDVMWTTAGSGVVHNEDVEPYGNTRILQLWMTLPSEHRWAKPRFVHMPREAAALREEPGVEARIYSGASGDVSVVPQTYLPVTMVDVVMNANGVFKQELPSNYNGFLYVLEGEVTVAGTKLSATQVGWFDAINDDDDAGSTTSIVAGPTGARVVLYAGERQRVPLVMHGPFVAESRADLMRVSREYIEGRFPRVSEL